MTRLSRAAAVLAGAILSVHASAQRVRVPESADCKAWTYAYDVSAMSKAALNHRVDADVENPIASGVGVTPSQFVMDGLKDEVAATAFSNGGMQLHYALRGGKLYVATNDAGEGNDHFIFIAAGTASMVAAPWQKAGQVAQWAAYLADETDNDFGGWFDAQGTNAAATGANGGVLEGTIDLVGEFGLELGTLRVAVGSYATPTGGSLVPSAQIPVSLDNNGNIESIEYGTISLRPGWVQAGTGSWNDAWNWAQSVPNGIGAQARFMTGVTAASTATLDSPATIERLYIDTLHAVQIQGPSTLTFDGIFGSSSLIVVRGSHEITAPVLINDQLGVSVSANNHIRFGGPINVAASMICSGAGSVQLDGPVTAGAGAYLTVRDTLLRTTANLNGLGLYVGQFAQGGTVMLDASQHLGTLFIFPPGRVTLTDSAEVRTLTVRAALVNGTLDITDNAMIVDYTGASPLNDIRTAIINGYNNGSWNGNGIVSALAGAMTNRSIGYAEARTIGSPPIFLGESIDATSVLVRFTVTGDADLNGIVNISDFSLLAANFNTSSVWSGGDFNYSGTTDISDFALLAANFNTSLPIGLQRALIPEPAAVAMLGVLAVVRRRRVL